MGKPSAPTIGFWYRLAYHHGITIGPIDAFLGMDGGDKSAWRGTLTASGTISIDAPNLWGGEKDQGGIVGDIDVMFGEPTQGVNPYLSAQFGAGTTSWRGFTTLAFKGGRYGAMNPYPQKPSYKFRRIKQGWDDGCWYPEKAEITMVEGDPPIDFDYDGGANFPNVVDVDVGALTGTIQLQYATGPNPDKFEVWYEGTKVIDTGYHGKGAGIFAGSTTYQMALDSYLTSHSLPPETIVEMPGSDADANAQWASVVNRESASFEKTTASTTLTVKVYSPLSGTIWKAAISRAGSSGLLAANPAHVLYESLTNGDMGREPVENLDDASFRAAADKLFAEGFGICPQWNPAQESVEDFQKRICRLIGGSLNRSLEDGKWYLDLARGDYVLEDLPIFTDADIVAFKETPTTLDDAINSVSVKYFDPETKAYAVTAPARSLALVAAFGEIHQAYEYPEIPTASLAGRVATREVLATTTPTRAFDNAWKPTVRALRPNQYFRLQAPKRGIADMVCLVADKQSGTLKSGAIQMKVVQDIYGMPTTSFVQHEPGVDTRPPQTPNAIAHERAIEAPYIEVVAAMTRAEFEALPDDVGFAMAMAVAPAAELDFTLMVDAGAGYADQGTGHWAATATVNEAASRTATMFTLANAKLLANVTVGMAALWDDELVRVDAIDAGAGTLTLGRACGDTTPQRHAANSRVYFYEVGFGYDITEYTDGETVDVKLLSRTGSQLLAIGSATPMVVAFDQRLARPYPPAKLRINTEAEPGYLFGALTVGWVHRDRVLQADQVVDTEAATIGPEAGTTYTMRTYVDNVLDDTQTGISGNSATVTPSGEGTVRIEVEAVRDSLVSWQANTREFDWTTAALDPLELQDGDVLQTQSGDTLFLQS